jgi:pimeloyl-ACP methyl ester carboxylesterase
MPISNSGYPTHHTFVEYSLTTKDDRTLAYTEFGDPNGYPILFAHGMPGSRLEGRFFDNQARRWGFRIICMSRPGIGLSTYQSHRTLLDYASDTRELIEDLGIVNFVQMGWSSGGSRSLAVAYELGDVVKRCVIMSSYTNFAELPHSRTLLLKTRWPGPAIWEFSPKLFEWIVEIVMQLGKLRPGIYLQNEKKLVSQHDRELLAQSSLFYLFRQDQLECLQSGGRAITKDLETEICDWGFQLDKVSSPVWIYQGAEDPFVPASFSEHLHQHLSQSDYRILPNCGHLYPLDEVFQDQLFERLHNSLVEEDEKPAANPPCP